MDAITLALAKKYTNSQRIGHTETGSLKWDGDITGKESVAFDDYGTLVKITDEQIDLNKAKRLFFSKKAENGEVVKTGEKSIDELLISGDESATLITEPSGSPVWIMVVFDGGEDLSNGTYFFYSAISDESYIFLSSIETETIHQIDPKFIPGAVLPVVELSIDLFDSSINSVAIIDDEETKTALTSATDAHMPFVVLFSGDGVYFSTVFSIMIDGGTPSSVAILDNYKITLSMTTEGFWQLATTIV